MSPDPKNDILKITIYNKYWTYNAIWYCWLIKKYFLIVGNKIRNKILLGEDKVNKSACSSVNKFTVLFSFDFSVDKPGYWADLIFVE